MRGKKLTTEEFIGKAQQIHSQKYDYELVDYKNAHTKVKIICPKHGIFEQLPNNHLRKNGCKKCTDDSKKTSFNKIDEYYDYSKVNYINSKTKVEIICPIHGSFWQTPNNHLSKNQKCPKCVIQINSENKKYSIDDFINKSNIAHNFKYDYSETTYNSIKDKVKIICPIHGEFHQIAGNHLYGNGCPKCNNNGTSKMEKEIVEFIKELGLGVEENNITVLGGKELDIYIPEKQIAIEFNGLYWHSDLFKEDKYHLKKLEECESMGIKLIQIFEDEWLNKQEIVKSRLRNILGKIENKIYARKCIIKELDSKTVTKFLNENHLQGTVGSKIKLGLFHNDELVSIMTFGNLRKNLGQKSKDDTFELLRFCNKLNINIIGGASKLFKYFISNYSCVSVISYSDRRWGSGELYGTLGFKHIHNSQPNYFYVKNGEVKREARFKYRKDILVSEGFDKNKTEKQIMIDRNYFRIYDCGAMKFMYEKCGD